MKKSTKTIIGIVAVVAAFVLVLFALGKLDSYETRLKKAMDYEQILLKEGQYAFVRIDEDRAAFVCPTASGSAGFYIYVEFDLDTMEVSDEFYVWRNGGPYLNEFAENARRDHYAFDAYKDVKHGRPSYYFYMGLSEVEPAYELIGERTSALQYTEINGYYFFMYLQDFEVYISAE